MLSITIDIDWAPDQLIQNIVDVLHDNNIKATFFITHSTKVDFKNFELAVHPNFLVDKAPDSVLQNIMEIVPSASGVRSHSLVTSARIQRLFFENNFLYSSNFFLDTHKHIEPAPYMGILEIPIYFIDNLFIHRYQDNQEKINLKSLHLENPGVKSLLFHPTNIFLNLEKMERHEMAKPIWKDEEKLSEIVNRSSYGIKNLFNDLITYLKINDVETYTLNDIARKYQYLCDKS